MGLINNQLESLTNRLNKIGIKIECWSNYPWIYLHKVNGNLVKEKHHSEHAFTICYQPKCEILDIKKTFEIIRKYK